MVSHLDTLHTCIYTYRQFTPLPGLQRQDRVRAGVRQGLLGRQPLLSDVSILLAVRCSGLSMIRYDLYFLGLLFHQAGTWLTCSMVHNAMYVITGASPSESHIVEFAMEFLIYTYFVRRAVSHFRILFCTFLHHLLIQKLFTNYFYSTQQEDINHLATARTETTCGPTYVFNGSNDRCYRMAKRFHLSMPLFVLPLTVKVTRYMD